LTMLLTSSELPVRAAVLIAVAMAELLKRAD
jgi:hypothetical protein